MTDGTPFQSPKKRRKEKDHYVNGANDPQNRHATAAISNARTVAELTQELERLDSRRAALFMARTRALANKGKVADAISDASKAIECQPSSAEAYLALGEVYSIQGKQQEAVDVYECGLRTVLPSDWCILYEKREAATEQMNRRIDFVPKLPLEITETIFAQLLQSQDHKPYVHCASVSKLWRHAILHQCPMLWKNVTMHSDSLDDPLSDAHLLPFIGKHVQYLGVHDVPDPVIETLVAMVEQNKIASVKGMTIVSPIRSFQSSIIPLIAAMRNTLTKLTITLETIKFFDASPTLLLDSILSQCPNLDLLSVTSKDTIAYQLPQSPPPDGYLLQEISLDILHSDEILAKLLPHCPRLQALFVRDRTAMNLVTLIHQHCPRLRYLKTHPRSDYGRNIILNGRAIPKDTVDTPSGLYSLEHFGPITQEFIPIFDRSKDTLKCLRLSVEEILFENMDPLAFAHLTEISLLLCWADTEAAASILRQSSMLEQVELCCIGDGQTSFHEMSTSLSTLEHLQILKLRGFESATIGKDLEQLFIHCGTRHHPSCKLQQISILGCDSYLEDEPVLKSLTDITTLQSIEFRNSFRYMSDHMFEAFVRKAHTMPNLKSIAFEDMTCVTNADLIHLAHMGGLESLELAKIHGVTTRGVFALANKIPYTLKVCKIDGLNIRSNATSYLES